ncbi:uncharacterized protein LOC107792168 isoform X7 [Nicotiana tabacum]|uniref:Uncharacterized protein LOC107792168 isoform X7 n=1 Tax=Nicotiana tabacum TaxID=4097 RepID=A0AC58UD33_TOBAC
MESFKKMFNGNIPVHDFDQRSDENVENDFEKLSKDFFSFKKYVMDSFAKLFDENNNLRNRFAEKSDAKSDGMVDEHGNADIGSPNNNQDQDRLDSVGECQKGFPTFDGGDYPILRESQIAILE